MRHIHGKHEVAMECGIFMVYGGAWSKGRDQFIFLRGHGLQVSCQPKIKVGVETRTDAAEI